MLLKKWDFAKMGGVFDPIQKADIVFLYLADSVVELVAPHKDSDVYPLLKRYRNAPYHICYAVDNIERALDDFKNMGCALFRAPAPAIAISANAQVAFLMNRHIGMIELVEM